MSDDLCTNNIDELIMEEMSVAELRERLEFNKR